MRKTTAPLDAGEVFPSLSVSLLDGKTLVVPAGLSHPFNIVLLNRGHWCPFCSTQLKSFQQGLSKLNEEGIGVISISADPVDKARAAAEERGVTFPIAFGVSPAAVATALGAFYDPGNAQMPAYLQSAGFVLGSGGKIISATYSTGPIGRLIWQDALGLVQYVKQHAPA